MNRDTQNFWALEHLLLFSARALTRGTLMEITGRGFIAAARTHVATTTHTRTHSPRSTRLNS
jgi:hypothetical protein